MVCEHLAELEQALLAANIPITFRGQPWTSNCREWVYFACWLDRPAIRSQFTLADCVHDHDHLGTHDGQEAGSCVQPATTPSWAHTRRIDRISRHFRSICEAVNATHTQICSEH